MTHVVILGGGFGGLDAARALKGAPVRVTLVDRHNYHLFQPLLYQVATASLSPADVASPIRWILRHQPNVQVLLGDVTSIDPAARQVSVSPHLQLDYDYLIVATGAAHAYFGHPDWAARAPGLKTLDDALEIRRQVLLAFEAAERERDEQTRRRLLTFVIVGGGPTGVELAGALAEIAHQTLKEDFRSIQPETARIVLIEGGPHVLPTFPENLRLAARESLTKLGVDVRTNTMVIGIDEQGVSFSTNLGEARSAKPAEAPRAKAGKTERIDAVTVLWAAGVAASPLATSLGVPLDRVGRVAAEPTLQVTGHPEIFVAGDICALEQDGKPLPGVAQVAKQQGAHAARNIMRAVRGQPLTAFRYRDYGNAATIGRGAAVVDMASIKASGLFAWLFWLFLHIFWLIGFRNRVAVLGEWAWAYVTFQRRARLITGEKLSPNVPPEGGTHVRGGRL